MSVPHGSSAPFRPRRPIRRFASWAAALGFPLLAAAEGPADGTAPAAGEPANTNASSWVQGIDRKHSAISSYVIGFGEGMDALLSKPFREPVPKRRNGNVGKFINDPRLVEDTQGSRIKLSPSLRLRDAEGFDFGMHFNGKLRLPRFSDRLEFIVDSEFDDEVVQNDLRSDEAPRLQGDRDGIAALRYHLRETLNFKASIDAGLKFKPEPVPRLSLRLRGYHDHEYVTTRLTQTFFWETQDGFGTRTQFDLDQQELHDYLRRLTTTILWSEVSEGVEAGESFSHFKYLTKRRVIGGRIGVTGHLEPTAQVDVYTVRAVYRQRLHRDWLFMEIEPGVDWPRERDFKETPFINLKFDIIFGDWGEGRR